LWKIHNWNYKLVIANNYLIKPIEHNFFYKKQQRTFVSMSVSSKRKLWCSFYWKIGLFLELFFNWKSISGSAISDKCNANFSLCSLILTTAFNKIYETNWEWLKKLIPRISFLLFTKEFSTIAQPPLDIISLGYREWKVFPLFVTLSFNSIIFEIPTFFKYLKRLF